MIYGFSVVDVGGNWLRVTEPRALAAVRSLELSSEERAAIAADLVHASELIGNQGMEGAFQRSIDKT